MAALLAIILSVVASPASAAAPGDAASGATAPKQVAWMVVRPDNRLAWNSVDERSALLLACDQILRDYVGRSEELTLVNEQVTNGAQRAAATGLYFLDDGSRYDAWQAFLEADVYVECDLTPQQVTWRGYAADREVTHSVDQPFAHPKAMAAALVRTVFETAGVAIPDAWQAELADPETASPRLFIEWAQWIGYRPHWLHHAPWRGPRTSAQAIIEQDPNFHRGMAWALPTILIKPKDQKVEPSGVQFFQHAFRVLDSPFHASVYGFVRKTVESPNELREALGYLDIPLVDLQMDVSLGGNMGEASRSPTLNDPNARKDKPSGPQLRANVVRALAGVQKDQVINALKVVLIDDASPEVRAAAAEALGEYDVDKAGRPLHEAAMNDKAPAVRAAAVSSLAKLGALDAAGAKRAAGDDSPLVREAVAMALDKASLDAARSSLAVVLLNDDTAAVRSAAIASLRRTADFTPDAAVLGAFEQVLVGSEAAPVVAALTWAREARAVPLADAAQALLDHDLPVVRAQAGLTLVALKPGELLTAIDALKPMRTAATDRVLADLLARSSDPSHRALLMELLGRVQPALRGEVCTAAYRAIGDDRAALARIMQFDPVQHVNIAAFRLANRLGDRDLQLELFNSCAASHPNEYIRARALRELEAIDAPSLREHCLAGLTAPFWVVRLEAADILARHATSADIAAIEAAMLSHTGPGEWLTLALEDALAHAKGQPAPQRIALGLGDPPHLEGGHDPHGFQIWLDTPPADADQARAMVEQGVRFGFKTVPPNVPGGTTVGHVNNDKGLRNSYIIEAVLDPLEQHKAKLPYMYYVANFDEPMNFHGNWPPNLMRAFLLEVTRPDLLPLIDETPRDELVAILPSELQSAYSYYAAKLSGEASNWVTHQWRLTAQRKYPDLRIFPQTLSYMRQHSNDALDMIDADGDYTWLYHYGNFFRDGAMGAMNRVLNPGKPLNSITWLSWWKPNVLHGNTLYADTEFPEGPWRYRNYMGTRSALALYATGVTPGFFSPIGLGKASDKDKPAPGVLSVRLHPWSAAADAAIDVLLDDPGFWKSVEGKIAVQQLKKKTGGGPDIGADPFADDAGLDGFSLEDGPTPLEKAMADHRKALREKLMTGIGYMNIFNTDTTRALCNLPRPDTSPRSSLIICGRDTMWFADGAHMYMPAIALLDGYDLAPTYDAVRKAELMQYDTILLNASADGVTGELVAKINHWLREKDGGLLIVSGDPGSSRRLFPQLTLDHGPERYLWDSDVKHTASERVAETYEDRRGHEQTRMVFPSVNSFAVQGGAQQGDDETRVACTYEGKVTPLVTTADGRTLLARWQAPGEVKSVVLFDGADSAGPVYTGALEQVVTAIDRERGSDVKRNRYWGHTLYETDAFVVDVATSQLDSLLAARPRQHQGVDIITGVINPEVRHGECALVLKDYVGPYAGGQGDWAVMARHELKAMKVASPGRLEVHAAGPTRVTHIGPEPIRLESTAGFVKAPHQVALWKLMREGKRGYCVLPIEGGYELHFVSDEPVAVVVE